MHSPVGDYARLAAMHALGLMLFVVGLALGHEFPDFDQSTTLLLHRSIITHGPWVPVMLAIAAMQNRSIPLRWLAMGVSLGLAVHLAFDLFPRGWSGYALISAPFHGWTTPAFSQAWIALSALASAFVAARLARGRLEEVWWRWGRSGCSSMRLPMRRRSGTRLGRCWWAGLLRLCWRGGPARGEPGTDRLASRGAASMIAAASLSRGNVAGSGAITWQCQCGRAYAAPAAPHIGQRGGGK